MKLEWKGQGITSNPDITKLPPKTGLANHTINKPLKEKEEDRGSINKEGK